MAFLQALTFTDALPHAISRSSALMLISRAVGFS
jgi:hypothetical protein